MSVSSEAEILLDGRAKTEDRQPFCNERNVARLGHRCGMVSLFLENFIWDETASHFLEDHQIRSMSRHEHLL